MTQSNKEIIAAINELKQSRNAVILAHYYQDPHIQDIADILGDSLHLAKEATKTDADVILLCGVYFMAEMAKILNPSKQVLLPDLSAGCSLANSCPPDEFAEFVAQHPDHQVVTYINSSAKVKALSDIICTSANAERVINSLPGDKPIIFAPDKHLGRYIQQQTGREMLLWDGACSVHELFSEQEIIAVMEKHPEAKLIAHPECEASVLQHADFIGSTTALISFVEQESSQAYIVATEEGVIHQMQKVAPGKTFIPAPTQDGCACNQCPYMRLNTLEAIHDALLNMQPEIILPEALQSAALIPLERMLQVS